MPGSAVALKPSQTVPARPPWSLLLVTFGVIAVLQILVASRSGLWADEIFSLALATGHSVEHPAAAADPKRGDFVEPNHPVPAEEFRSYLKHDDPPANPARVIRAVLLSDTNPPLYYLLLYAWTLVFGTSDIVLRLFSITCALGCLPFLVSIAVRTGGSVFSSCVLFALSPLGIYYSTDGRMYSLLWLCVLATTCASLVLQQRGQGIAIFAFWIVASVAGFLTHYFFVFPWLALVAYLSIRPGKLPRLGLAACLFLTVLLIVPWYVNLPGSLSNWRITKDWLKWQPPGFDRLAAAGEVVLQSFSGGDNRTLILFGVVGVVMVGRLRLQVFREHRLLLWLSFAAACLGPLAFDLVQHTYAVAVPRYAIAALPFAYLLAAVGLACLGRRERFVMLTLIILAWTPTVLGIYRSGWRTWSPLREVSYAACANGIPSDLILIHSIPSGVLGVARYAQVPAGLASWVGQLGTRRVPESLRTLAEGRTRIVLVKVHEVGEPAPEEAWLRANAVVFDEINLGEGRIIDFRPRGGKTF
jgi:hypothetical protein